MAVEPSADGFGALAEGRWDDARAAFEAALAGGETAEACFGLAMSLWWLGENRSCVERCGRAFALFTKAGDAHSAAQCAVWLAMTYKANFGNFPAANGWLARAQRLIEPFDVGPSHGWLWVARGYRMTDLDTAAELTERAVEVARASGDVDLELVALAQLGVVRVGKGETEAGFALIDEAMAALARARGDARAAGRLLEQRLRHLEAHRGQLAGALDLPVDAYIAAGKLEVAAGAAVRLHATAEAASSQHLNALAASARGRVLVARGDPTGITDLETALDAWSSMQFPLETARTRAELAGALAASEPDASIDHARRALATFEELGASIDADRVAAFLRSAGIVPRIGPKRAGVLTIREREMLRLVSAGLSNPEIAERLHVSRKTASHHVSNILTKLGLRNRAEAAAHAMTVLGEADGSDLHRT